MKRRILCLLLALSLLVSVVPAVSAEESYQLKVTHVSETGVAVTGYSGELPEALVIPDTLEGCKVVGIYAMAFVGAPIKSVTIPDTVRTIQNDAFRRCRDLQAVDFGQGVESIGRYAFQNCDLQGLAVLPASLRSLDTAFDGNPGLEGIVLNSETVKLEGWLPSSAIIYIHESMPFSRWDRYARLEDFPYDVATAEVRTAGALRYVLHEGKAYVVKCTAASDEPIPAALEGCPVVGICPYAFEGLQPAFRVTIPDTVTWIGRGAFRGSGATVTALPKSLCKIDEYAMSGVTLLDGTVPDGVKKLPFCVFEDADIRQLSLPALDVIESEAFSRATVDTAEFRGPVRELEASAFNSIRTDCLAFPEGLEVIESGAFGSPYLKTLYLPSTVTKCDYMLDSSEWKSVAVYGYTDTPVYDYCLYYGVTFVDRETGIEYTKPHETRLNGVRYLVYPNQYAAVVGTELGCPEELVIPETVEGLPVTRALDWAFSNSGARSITLPDTLTTLYDMAFAGNPNLESVRLSENLTYVGSYCFDDCPKLRFLYIPASVTTLDEEFSETFLAVEAGSYAEEYCKTHRNRYLIMDANTEYAYEGNCICTVEDGRAELIAYVGHYGKSIEVPDTVEGYPVVGIAPEAVYVGSYSTTLYLGRNVEYVGENCLSGTGLHELHTYPALTSLPESILPSYGKIYGFAGTYAEDYANAHDLLFIPNDGVPFTDVAQDSWYFPWVYSCYWSGFMSGTTPTTFAPDKTASRAMLVTVLWRMTGCDYSSMDLPFSDVKAGVYYHDAVAWALENGVVNGVSATKFAPNDAVTREQTAAILFRMAGMMGLDVESFAPLHRFSDGNDASPYARSALMWAVEAGILQGDTNGLLKPRGKTTRAQLAAILVRFAAWAEEQA